MKTKSVYGLLGLLILGAAAIAQTKPTAAADEAAIRALEQKWDAANLKGDAATLASIYADTFVSTSPEGKLRTRAEVLAEVKSGDIKYQAAKADDLKVYLYGDAAVVTGRWTGKFTQKGKVVNANERFTDMFVRQSGQWRCVASQASPIQ